MKKTQTNKQPDSLFRFVITSMYVLIYLQHIMLDNFWIVIIKNGIYKTMELLVSGICAITSIWMKAFFSS